MAEYNTEYDEDEEVEPYILSGNAKNEMFLEGDLSQTLQKFGYTKEDRIERRDLVSLFKTVEKDMERQTLENSHDGKYTDAKATRNRLDGLKKEFEDFQLDALSKERGDQRARFQLAEEAMRKELLTQHKNILSEVHTYQEVAFRNLERSHLIQWDNLENEIKCIPVPHVKYSKRLIELFKAEAGLIKLKEFDEASKVRNMVDRLRPREEKRFYARFRQEIEVMRKALRDQQEQELRSLQEKMKARYFTVTRKLDIESQILAQRLANNSSDMKHAHQLQSNLRPEMTIKPSALWQTRPGYKATSSALKGQLLLDRVRGKRAGEVVHADSLVARHDFEAAPEGTMEYR